MFAHRRRLAAFFLLPLALVVSPSCARVRAYYEVEFVTVDRVELAAPDHVVVEYHTLFESMFHSPGVDVVRGETELELRALRVFHEDDGDPDVRATSNCPGQRRVSVPLGGARRIVLADGIARRVLWDATPTSSS